MIVQSQRFEGMPLMRMKTIRSVSSSEESWSPEEETKSSRGCCSPRKRQKDQGIMGEKVEVIGVALFGRMAVGFLESSSRPSCDAAVASYLAEHPLFVRGKRVLQFSSATGSALCAISSWQAGSKEAIVATRSPQTLALARRSLRASRCDGCVSATTLDDVVSARREKGFDLCLALDVFNSFDLDDALVPSLITLLQSALSSSNHDEETTSPPFAVVSWTKRNDLREHELFEALSANFDLTILDDLPHPSVLKLDPDAAIHRGHAVPLHSQPPEKQKKTNDDFVIFRVERPGSAAQRPASSLSGLFLSSCCSLAQNTTYDRCEGLRLDFQRRKNFTR